MANIEVDSLSLDIEEKPTCEKESRKNFHNREENILSDYLPLDIKENKKHADLAHLVERDLAKVEVAGSSPVIRSNLHGLV